MLPFQVAEAVGGARKSEEVKMLLMLGKLFSLMLELKQMRRCRCRNSRQLAYFRWARMHTHMDTNSCGICQYMLLADVQMK